MFFTSLLLTLAGVAASYGLFKSEELITSVWAEAREMTADDIKKLISGITNEARSKGERVLNKINEELTSLDLSGIPPTLGLKQFIQNHTRQEKDRLNKLRNDVTENLAKLNTADERANTLAVQSDSTRASQTGVEIKADIKQTAQDAANAISDIEKEI